MSDDPDIDPLPEHMHIVAAKVRPIPGQTITREEYLALTEHMDRPLTWAPGRRGGQRPPGAASDR